MFKGFTLSTVRTVFSDFSRVNSLIRRKKENDAEVNKITVFCIFSIRCFIIDLSDLITFPHLEFSSYLVHLLE